jgi:hypothetical protein
MAGMCGIRSLRRAAVALATWFVLALGFGQRPEQLCAQNGGLPAAPVELVLDLSSGMRGPVGDAEKMDLAREFVRALSAELAAEGTTSALGLRVYGADAARSSRDCRDSRLVVPAGDVEADLPAALSTLQPRGIASLAYALEAALTDSARTYVLITGGLGECGGDACSAWREVAARGTNRNARLHVVAIAQEPQEVGLLRCLSRAGSGTFMVLSDADDVGRAASRLALILKNQGLIDVRLSLGDEETLVAPVRVLVPRSGEVVAAFTGRRPRSLPAGVYTIVLETAPPITIERVMVLPGEIVTIERSDFGRLEVEMRDREDHTARAPLTVFGGSPRTKVRYGFTGDDFVLQSGTYDVAVDLGDSLVTRRDIVIDSGRTTRVALGGAGTLLVVSPEFPTAPTTRVIVSRGMDADTLQIGEPLTVAAGRYRLRVETIPVYVSDEVIVEYGETTTVELPPVGSLRVSLTGPEGPIDGVVARLREPLTGERYGGIASGETRLVMPGTYRIDLETVPPQRIEDVVVLGGQETIVERPGFSRVEVLPAATGGTYRLEILVASHGRRLAEAVGTAPSLTVFPGSYYGRVFRGPRLVWEGDLVVAPDKPARIDLPRP